MALGRDARANTARPAPPQRLARSPDAILTTPSPIPLSVLIRTLNEADRIAAALAALQPLGAEIVVIDAGSTDETVAIAEAHGARVIANPWPGFGPQRFFGEERCGHDFVFSLDADEIVTPELAAEIRAVFLAGTPPPLMIVKKAMIMPHQQRPQMLPFSHEQVLIYDRRVARTGQNPNWDRLDIKTDAKPVKLKEPLWHYSLRDWHHAIGKLNYVAKLAAETSPGRSGVLATLRLVVELPVTFFKFYVLRRYFLSGRDGFVMAVVTAFGRFARLAMLDEKARHGRREDR
jgi:glycosyltransferase involved in cell wall biosynthesis